MLRRRADGSHLFSALRFPLLWFIGGERRRGGLEIVNCRGRNLPDLIGNKDCRCWVAGTGLSAVGRIPNRRVPRLHRCVLGGRGPLCISANARVCAALL